MITKQDLQDAYREGFQDGKDHNNLPYRFPPLAVAWIQSVTRESFFPPPAERQYDLITEWENLSTDEKYIVAESPCTMTLLEDESEVTDLSSCNIPLDSTFVVGLTDAPEMWWSDID